MERVCVFPGSFDPITLGHEDIVRRAANLFDRIIVAIGVNSQKKYLFPLEQRLQWIDEIFDDLDNVSSQSYDVLTIDFCNSVNAKYLLRGLRSIGDFEYEKSIAQLNQSMQDDIETIFMLTRPAHAHISSTIVREIIRYKGDASPFLPRQIKL